MYSALDTAWGNLVSTIDRMLWVVDPALSSLPPLARNVYLMMVLGGIFTMLMILSEGAGYARRGVLLSIYVILAGAMFMHRLGLLLWTRGIIPVQQVYTKNADDFGFSAVAMILIVVLIALQVSIKFWRAWGIVLQWLLLFIALAFAAMLEQWQLTLEALALLLLLLGFVGIPALKKKITE